MLTLALLAARSTSTLAIPAWCSRFLMNPRMRMSSCRSTGYSFSANQRDSHPSMTPRRNPFGCTFCPMLRFLISASLIHHHGEVAGTFANWCGAAVGSRDKSFQGCPAVHIRPFDVEHIRIDVLDVGGVGYR